MSPRGLSGASKSQKAAFSKTLKNMWFLKVFGSRGLPREPQEAQEGSQEAPKELQNLQNKGSKNRPQKSQVLDQFWVHFGAHFGTQKWTKNGTKHGTIFGSSGPWSRWPQVGRFWPQVAHPDRHTCAKKGFACQTSKKPKGFVVLIGPLTSIQEPTTITKETLLKLRFPFGFRSLLEP